MEDINGCESENLFKVYFKDGAMEEHCSNCLSNIIREIPEEIIKMEAL